jgi:subtilisin family serine protease
MRHVRSLAAALAVALLATPWTAAANHMCPGKLSAELENQIDDPQYADVMIDVVIQMLVAPNDPAYADVQAIAAAAPTKIEKVKQVYNAIRQEADTIQTRTLPGGTSVRDALADGVAAGLAGPGWEPHWLGNELAAKAKPALLRDLCARADVERIALARGGQKPVNTLPDPTNPTWNITRIGADYAWSRGVTGRGAKVGVIDTGVNANHEALVSRCSGGSRDGYSCIGGGAGGCGSAAQECEDGGGVCLGPAIDRTTGQPYWKDVTTTASPTPIDDQGHGTFVLGVAVGQNGVGVAPEANWMACKALLNNGGFPYYQTENWLTDCAEFLINPHGVVLMDDEEAADAADVIVLPYVLGQARDDAAACDPLSSSDQSFQQKVARMRAMDILPVFPVGENLQTGSGAVGVPVPANYRPSLAVGMSLDSETYAVQPGQDPVDPASNRGSILCLDDQTSTSTRPAPSVVAPGRGVLGPWMEEPCPDDPAETCPNTYHTLAGSDVAAAHVAGAAALLRALNPDLSAQRSPLFLDNRYFNLDEVLKRRGLDYVESPFRAGRLDLRAALDDFGSPGAVIANAPFPFYTSEPGIPNRHTVSVAMRNWSPYTWTQGPTIETGAHGPIRLVDAAFPADAWRAGRIALPVARVAPGEEVTFTFPITAPDTLSGSYQYRNYDFQWRLLREDPDTLAGQATADQPIRVDGRDRALGGTISPALSAVPASPCRSVTVSMQNSGTTTWTALGTPGASGYSARYRLYQPNGVTLISQGTVNVSGVVLPGASYGFSVPLCAPVADGTYPFQLEVLRDGVPLAFGTALQSSMPVTNAAAIDTAAPSYWVWEWAPGYGYPTIHWSLVLKNTGNRIWDANYCLREIRGRSWASGGLPVAPRCLVGGTDVVAPNASRRFDGWLSVEAAPFGLWWYQLQMYRSTNTAFGPAPAGLVDHQWTLGASWSATQGPQWFFFADHAYWPPSPTALAWRSANGRWERWDGNSWENPWIDPTSLRPAAWGTANRAWKSPTSGWARVRAVFNDPGGGAGCEAEDGVGIEVVHFDPSWYAIEGWYPNSGDGLHLKKGHTLTIDSADPVGTVNGDPNGFWVNAGDYIATRAGIWNNGDCDRVFDNDSSAPLTIWIYQKTPETPTQTQ